MLFRSLRITATRDSKTTSHSLQLERGWKKTDFGWRGSRWSLKPRPGFWAPLAKDADVKALGLPEASKAYRIQWINTSQAEGRAAKQAGFREGDMIVEVAGKPVTLTPEQFHMFVRTNFQVGDKLPLTIVRDGQRQRLDLPLVD